MIQFMVALKDELDIKTLIGTMTKKLNDLDEKTPRYYKEKLKASDGEATRNNVSYLQQATGKPVYRSLKGLQGF